jgi:starvation-inducible outer membrane lipoprotein
MRALDPLDFRDRRVTILGKLEPVEEGSKNLIIRARLMRSRD